MRKIFGLSAKCFGRDCQRCILRVHRNILGLKRKVNMFTPNLQIPGERKSIDWEKYFPFVIYITTEIDNVLYFWAHYKFLNCLENFIKLPKQIFNWFFWKILIEKMTTETYKRKFCMLHWKVQIYFEVDQNFSKTFHSANVFMNFLDLG